jgi:hypothetical protein
VSAIPGLLTSAYLTNSRPRSYFAYRELGGGGLGDVVHVIPEFVLLNASGREILVAEPGRARSGEVVRDGEDVKLKSSGSRGLVINMQVKGLGVTNAIKVDDIGTKIVNVCEPQAGGVVGALRISVMAGGKFARIVGRISMMESGLGGGGEAGEGGGGEEEIGRDMGEKDVVRVRASAEQLRLVLKDVAKQKAAAGGGRLAKAKAAKDAALDIFSLPAPPERQQVAKPPPPPPLPTEGAYSEIAEIVITDVIFDFRRIFRLVEATRALEERNRTVLGVKAVSVLDREAGSPFPVVLEGDSRLPIMDLQVQWSGSL